MKLKKNAKKVVDTLGLLVVSAIFLLPFVWMLLTSVKTEVEAIRMPIQWFAKKPQWINFATAWKSGPFPLYIRNSFLYAGGVIIVQLITTLPAAYGYAKFNFRGKNFFFYLTMSTMMIPSQLIFVPMYQMMSSWSLIDTMWSLILPFSGSAFNIFMMRQAYMNVPDELIEAAKIDGMRDLGIVLKIATPMCLASLSTFVLFSVISHWNDYFWPLIMTNSDNIRPITIGVQRLKDTEGNDQWNVIMAGNMFLVGPNYGFLRCEASRILYYRCACLRLFAVSAIYRGFRFYDCAFKRHTF